MNLSLNNDETRYLRNVCYKLKLFYDNYVILK